MKTWTSFSKRIVVALLLVGVFKLPVAAVGIHKVTNVSPSPTLTNEFYLTATNITTSINGTNVKVLVYMDDPPSGGGAPAGIPGPLIEATPGQMIICHFKNRLTNNIEGATVHWHGIELDNDSDGTSVTQDTIFNGQTYTYRFIAPRPGVFWYHSHMLPGTTTFGGMYGPIIIKNPEEAALIAANVLPSTNNTFPLVLSDISFTNGFVGKVYNGTNFSLNSLIQYCENSILGNPNADGNACSEAGLPGNLVLVNGTVPNLAHGFFNCIPNTSSTPIYYVGKNQRVRLQLFDTSISRDFNLSLLYPCFSTPGDTNLYQIGGQGGLLDFALVNGGVQSGYDFLYPRGSIVIGTGMRSDVMFYTSTNVGDVIRLVGNPLPRPPWNLSEYRGGLIPTNYPVAFFVITNTAATNSPLFAGAPILSGTGTLNENLRLLNTNAISAPPLYSLGASSGAIVFSNGVASNGASTGPNIGGYAATALDGNSGFGSWLTVPHPPTAVWARIGDVLQLAIVNEADTGGPGAMHPYHLHGFSMQPVAIYSSNLQTNLYNFPYNQFVDTYEVLPNQALVFRIKLTDRPIFADTATGGPVTTGVSAATGGGIGRWLMHCHIFMHGAVGMISELVVQPNNVTRLVSSSAGTNSVIHTDGSGVSWTGSTNAPWLHLTPGSASGSGTATVLFTYDANPSATRVGNVNIGSQIVNVTQAGTNYVQAPGPLTGLVTNGIVTPYGIDLDSSGNVYFSAAGSGAVKRWNRSDNTISTVVSGLSSPYGLGVDRLDRAFIAQYGSTAVTMYSVASGFSTVFNNDTTGVAGLAVDDGGNVYITVPNQHTVKKWAASTGALTAYTTNGLINPWGVAVDKAGALYAADIGDDTVKKLGFKFVPPFFFIPNWNTVITSSDLSNPYNLAVDDGGNIFIADYSHGAIKKFSAASNTVTTVVSGLSNPTGVTVDKTGNVFLSDWSAGAVRELPYAFVDPTPQSEPAELTVDTLPVVLLPDENLLPPFAPTPNQAWIFYGGSTTGVVQFAVGANVGGPRSGTITVLGQPITINQDGASWKLATTNLLVGPIAGSNTVTELVIPTVGTWNASTATPWLHLPFASGTGSANILFTYDNNPGATRIGTINLNGQVLTVTQAGATYVPAAAPATTLVSVGLVHPVDVAPDALGNVIFADSGNDTVKKWSPGSLTASTVISGGIITPQGVAVDGLGNIYVSDFGNHAIKQWRAVDSNVVTLVSTPYSPEALSLGYGTNIYWGMPGNNSVNEWIAASSNSVVLVNTGLSSPYGVAADIAGNVFIADTSANAIKKWDPLAASLTTVTTSGINSPWNVAVDGSGNVYVANGSGNNILEWVAASGNIVTIVPNGLSIPTDVKVDANQNLYIADFGNGAVKELPHAFVDTSTKSEPASAGNDALPVVLPPGQNLSGPFAPTDNAPWLTINSTNGGVVSFSFTANTNTLARAATITLLGQAINVTQDAAVYPPVIINPSMPTNGVFQFGFTNGTRGATYSVLFTTNVTTPMSSWIVIGTALQVGPDLWQFTDNSASNNARFYRIRSP